MPWEVGIRFEKLDSVLPERDITWDWVYQKLAYKVTAKHPTCRAGERCMGTSWFSATTNLKLRLLYRVARPSRCASSRAGTTIYQYHGSKRLNAVLAHNTPRSIWPWDSDCGLDVACICQRRRVIWPANLAYFPAIIGRAVEADGRADPRMLASVFRHLDQTIVRT